MKIEGKEIDLEPKNYLSPVTFVPSHAKGNVEHPDCEQGVLLGVAGADTVRVLYCNSRTIQITDPDDLVWG